jgi:hypothetical protein
LVTSLLYVMVLYLLVKYGVDGRLIAMSDFVTGIALRVAAVGTFLTFGPTVIFPRLMNVQR